MWPRAYRNDRSRLTADAGSFRRSGSRIASCHGEMAARRREGRGITEARRRRVASVSPEVGDGTKALAYSRCRGGRRVEEHPESGRVLRAVRS